MLRFSFLLLFILITACENAVKFNTSTSVSSCDKNFTLEDRTISGNPGESVLINLNDLTRPLTIEFRDRQSFHLITTRSVPAGEARVTLPDIAGAYEMIVQNNCGSTGYSYATATYSTTDFSVEPSKRLSSIGNTVSTYSVASVMSSADIDLDGDMDLMYLLPDGDPAGGYVPEFEVNLNNGSGVFTLSSALSTFGTSYSTWFTLADVTGDGRADLVYSIQNPISGVCVRAWNTITSKFGSELCSLHVSVSPTEQDSINKFQLHDFNRDGHVDIALAVNESNGTAVYDGALILMIGRSDGTFSQISGIDNLGPIHNFILADINNDGLVDVTVASSDISTQLYYNVFFADTSTGLINQDAKTVITSSLFDDGYSIGIRSMNVTDINDDKILDFVAVNENFMEQVLSSGITYALSSNSSMITQYSGSLALADIDHTSQGEELFVGMKNRAHNYSYTGNFGGTLFLREPDYDEDLDWDSSNTLLNDVSSANWRFISHHMMDYDSDGHLDVIQLDGKYQQMIHFFKGSP